MTTELQGRIKLRIAYLRSAYARDADIAYLHRIREAHHIISIIEDLENESKGNADNGEGTGHDGRVTGGAGRIDAVLVPGTGLEDRPEPDLELEGHALPSGTSDTWNAAIDYAAPVNKQLLENARLIIEKQARMIAELERELDGWRLQVNQRGYEMQIDSAKQRIAELEAALDVALEALENAVEDIENWAVYASEYFQAKHDLQGTLAKHHAAIAKLREVRK